jgi:regulator of protease activity HflC (stomatin/prohibitin superfamily)
MNLLLASIVILGLLWLANRLVQGRAAPFTTVYEWDHALAYVDGRFDRVLPPGRYMNVGLRRRDVYTLRNTDQVHTTPFVDVTSSDKFVFRLSAVAIYRVVEPRVAFENGHVEKIRLAISAALIKLAGERTLDAILSDRAGLDSAFAALVGSPICGCEIRKAAIAGIALPPEIRRLFTEIERARLETSAALERARGEQAALRSLGNAARLLKGNPELMNLRVLQALATPGKGRPTLVIGPNGLLPLRSEAESARGA